MTDRDRFTVGLDSTAYAVRVEGQWFAGFGGGPGGPRITKLRKHLCDAKLVISRQRARDYITRLEADGHPGGTVHTIRSEPR